MGTSAATNARDAMRAHARHLAGLLADEDGPAAAADAVEEVLVAA